VITKYSPDFLKAAADAAGGTFIPAEATDKSGLIKAALATLRTQSRNSLGGEDRILRYQWFLLPGLLLLLLDTILAERRGHSPWQPAVAKTVAALVVFTMVGGCVRVTWNGDAVRAYRSANYTGSAAAFKAAVDKGDTTERTLYNLGTALIGADSLPQAADVLFNLGLADLEQGIATKDESRGEKLDAALASYKKVILMRPDDLDAKWNYELALHEKKGGGGGGGAGQSANSPSNPDQSPQPQGGLGQQQAEQLLGSAAREERDVQSKKQRLNKVEPPPGGKDW
jgi:Ca-activated chloride channel family protein